MSLENEIITTVRPDEFESLETNITDITITPDGRICCFGLSREIIDLLCESGLADQPLLERRDALGPATTSEPPM